MTETGNRADAARLLDGDEPELFDLWRLAGRRGCWDDVLRRATATGNEELARVAADVLAGLPPVSALQALEANRRLVALLTGRRWVVIQHAREQGCSWRQIAAALDVPVDAARGWFVTKIESQQRHCPDLHDQARARAALLEDLGGPYRDAGEFEAVLPDARA